MAERHNVDAKLSETKIEEEDSLRKVDCLRGRLLAERLASRNATKEAEQLGNKLLEMEKLLKEEARSRNRAEKKLKFLMKRLESVHIVHEIKENDESAKGSANLKENDSQISGWNVCDDSSAIEGSSSSNEAFHVDDNQMYGGGSTANETRMEFNQKDDEDTVDKSMAIVVAIEMPKKDERIDPKVVDASVKEALESLKRAKEQLLSSMERKRMSMSMNMIKVG